MQDASTADFSSSIVKSLKIKDFADAVTAAKNIQLKHPVCFECFDEILKQLEFKVKSQEQERDMYKQELSRIEEELSTSGARAEKEMLDELLKLEEEEGRLDQALDDAFKHEAT